MPAKGRVAGVAIIVALTGVPGPRPSLAAAAGMQRACPAPPGIVGADTPINYPDRYAWELFVQVNRRSEIQQSIARGDGTRVATNDAVWETWPDDPYTFPESPDPRNPPRWPEASRGKSLTLPALRAHLPRAAGNPSVEEVHRNRATFDFIIDNGLWYTQGIAAFFAANDELKFPLDSIEVKGNWIEIDEADVGRYHWNYDADGHLYGLVAMHISSKALPNWFWATFEWVDNKGRCDFIGCRDCFGFTPSRQPSNTEGLAQLYPPGEMTSELAALFAESGFVGDWGSQWSNYRLKGSQTDFVDATGVPTLLGNSITEGGFVQTASCITCHARAAVTAQGTNPFPVFGEKQPLPLQGESAMDLQTQNTTYNGAPDPNWFYAFTGTGRTKVNLQMDFVWAIPFQAKPAATGGSR